MMLHAALGALPSHTSSTSGYSQNTPKQEYSTLLKDKSSDGKATLPSLDQMLQDVRRGQLKTVGTWKLDRQR
jgi:DNA invertase Pin-like site-specific DNA recombinase